MSLLTSVMSGAELHILTLDPLVTPAGEAERGGHYGGMGCLIRDQYQPHKLLDLGAPAVQRTQSTLDSHKSNYGPQCHI